MKLVLALATIALVACSHGQAQTGRRVGKYIPLLEARRNRPTGYARLVRAGYLMVLGRDLDVAKRLILEAKELDAPSCTADGKLADLYELRGDLPAAWRAFRNVVVPPEGVQRSSSLQDAELFHFAQLSRRTGHPREEADALEKVTGENLGEKAIYAAVCAGEGGRHDWAVEFWEEALRHRPGDAFVVEHLAESKQNRTRFRDRLVAEARKALGLAPA